MRNLTNGLAGQGISVIGTSLAHTDFSRDAAFLAALERCDVIIINGEGTIHDAAPAGRRLLDILDARARRDRPVVLLNALWQNNPADWTAFLDRCAIVALRDSQSAAELRAAGFTRARLLPDLSLCGPDLTSLRRNGEIVGDSVRLDARQVLAHVAQARKAVYLPTKTLPGRIWRQPGMSSALWRVYNGTFRGPVPDFHMAPDEPAYLTALQTATGHITGRFHGICLSMVTQTPFLAMASTTSKIQTLLVDAGLGLDRLRDSQALAADPLQSIPPFSEREQAAIADFRARANDEAAQLFQDIRALL